jgi:hypothetical protein
MDPLSITASVIAIATLAYDGSKSIYDLIRGYIDASRIFEDLKSDIEGLNGVLVSLKGIGGTDQGASFSQAQLLCLREVEPALQSCLKACEVFKIKVQKLMSNSTPEHISKRDKFALQFKSNDLATFRIQLSSYKSTLTIALLVSSMLVYKSKFPVQSSLTPTNSKSSNENSKEARELGTKVEEAISLLTGQMEGMKISIQAIFDANLGTETMMEMMRQQVLPVSQCGNICKAAAALASQGSGNTYKRVEGFENSKFVMGNTNTQDVASGPENIFDVVLGRGHAKFWMGKTDAATALSFMND